MLDVTAVAWMLAAGDWFDTTSRVTSVVTLGAAGGGSSADDDEELGLLAPGGEAVGDLAEEGRVGFRRGQDAASHHKGDAFHSALRGQGRL